MKSLEIVNILLEDVKIKNKYVFERVYNAPIATSDLEQIKQDLEVLEILKEHLVLIPTGTNKEQLFIATDITNYLSEKDKEKFNKVKQWLEGNE